MIHADVQLLEHDVKRTQARILEHELSYLNKQLGHVATQAALLAAISFSSFNVQEGHLDLVSLEVQLFPTMTGALGVGLAFCTLLAAVFVRLWGSTEALRAQNEAHLRKAVLTFREERDFVVRLLMYTIICSVCNMSTVGFLYWAPAPAFCVLIIGLSGLWALFIVYTRIKARFLLCPTVFPAGFLFDDWLLLTGRWKDLDNLDLHSRQPIEDLKGVAPFATTDRKTTQQQQLKHQEFASDKIQKARYLHAEGNDGALMAGWLALKERRGRRDSFSSVGGAVAPLYYFRLDQSNLRWFRSLQKEAADIGNIPIDEAGGIKYRRLPRQREPYAHCIELVARNKTFILGTDDADEIEKWVSAFSAFEDPKKTGRGRGRAQPSFRFGISNRGFRSLTARRNMTPAATPAPARAVHSGMALQAPHNV